MEYSNACLCSGCSNNPKPCEHFESCGMKIGFRWDENGNEHYIGMGCNSAKCKRDNPDYKPLTKAQFIEMYKKMPNKTNISLYELLECARINGMVD